MSGSLPQQVPQRLRSDSEVARELQASFDNNYSLNIRQQVGLTRTDSEIARQLQDEWNNEDVVIVSNPTPTTTATATATSTTNITPITVASSTSTSSTPNTNTNDISSPSNGLKRHRSDSIATKDDENFVCYHYNGFESAASTSETTSSSSSTSNDLISSSHKLTKFKLYRR